MRMGVLKYLEEEKNIASKIDVRKYTSIMSCISHEMRTQMNSIISLSFLLKDESLNETKKENLVNYINLTCKQLITVFENFAELEFVVDKNIEKEEEKCYIDNLLAPLFDEFRILIINSGKQKVELINETQCIDLHEAIINKTNVYKILRCLFNTSLYNTEYGYIRIGFCMKNNGKLTFYVRDSGNGYEKTKEFINSSGIESSLNQCNDLYSAVNIFLAKKLVKALHGVIEIKHNGADGSEVSFTIPVKNVDKPKPTLYKFFNI